MLLINLFTTVQTSLRMLLLIVNRRLFKLSNNINKHEKDWNRASAIGLNGKHFFKELIKTQRVIQLSLVD